ncbi:hypothetical protein [Pseudoruegeria sp. HB172150]|uniref:hypothetical protein n=1 Tax=Pseudoruegeria sp. HB172150 TaxID=2721164 RepID=UPI0015536198|nr:hypothetical protein [Pseudoruegeria sp. HB172150]
MYKLVTTTALALALGSAGATAQETYAEELYAEGALTLSNMESHVKKVLEDNGVSPDCMGNLYLSDVVEMNNIFNSDGDASGKRQRTKVILDKRC